LKFKKFWNAKNVQFLLLRSDVCRNTAQKPNWKNSEAWAQSSSVQGILWILVLFCWILVPLDTITILLDTGSFGYYYYSAGYWFLWILILFCWILGPLDTSTILLDTCSYTLNQNFILILILLLNKRSLVSRIFKI